MNLLFPRLSLRSLVQMLGWAVAGAAIAGAFGIVHDHVTYTLGPEYFTRFKFEQFARHDPGWEPRVFVTIIGFLATWWVGLIAGWVLARCGADRQGRPAPPRVMLRHFVIMLGIAAAFGVGGYFYGVLRTAGKVPEEWLSWRLVYQVHDLTAFMRVAYVHNASYLGAIVGLVVSGVMVFRRREEGE